MRHCCSFDPIDIWVLINNEKFSDRKLSFGVCPICQKPIAELIQFNLVEKKFVSIRKIGFSSQIFVQSLKKQKKYSNSELNKLKFKSVPYGWIYGVNKEIHNKKSCPNKIKQYSSDFYGNKILVKEI